MVVQLEGTIENDQIPGDGNRLNFKRPEDDRTLQTRRKPARKCFDSDQRREVRKKTDRRELLEEEKVDSSPWRMWGSTGRFTSGMSKNFACIVSLGPAINFGGVKRMGPMANTEASIRPSPRPPQLQAPFVFPPATPPDSAKFGVNARQYSQDQLKDGEWSDTQKSGTPTRPRRVRSTGRGMGSPSRQASRRHRTQSLSTTDSQAAVVRLSRTGDYKIVIDHPNPASQNVSLPTIEVPIPHYRLGTPRFSARGTAFLHSSVYTRTSINDDGRSSAFSGPEHDRLWPVPPGMETRSVLSRRHSHASPQPYSVRIAPMNEVNSNVAVTSSPAFHRSKEPITAAMFDALALNPDDPAIVRYSPSTGEITAASPARIIAQITSKNFLDYELLSDFFLTVRSYLPTHELLAYLLARFEWAINRFDDDGRVIRVRAFAALRHWILNYFPYDFVMDRDLRVKFCERLNALSVTVRERSVHGPSDLKLILDLKKCWNGRCALYWDNQSLDNEGHDLDISPGGIAGSRDSELTHPSQLWARSVVDQQPRARIDSVVDPKESATALNNWFDAVIEAEDSRNKTHERQVSVITSRSLPTSPISEQSIQAMSCTLPGKGIKKMVAHSNPNAGAHPVAVPMTIRKVCPAAPSAIANDKPIESNHAHKRSGSFSDAFRDKRASLPSMRVEQADEPVMMAFPYSGSLIRGSVIPPGSPYLDDYIRNPSISDLRSLSSSSDSDSDTQESSKFIPLSPGPVKNLIGSIRRALSMRQVSGHPSSTIIGSSHAQSSKSSTLPLTVPQQQQHGEPQGMRQLEALTKQTRIDLLCADVAEVYERVLMQVPEQLLQPPSSSSIGMTRGNDHGQTSQDAPDVVYESSATEVQRNNSEVTYGSRSIVVINDTGDAPPPVPALPNDQDILAAENRSRAFKNIVPHTRTPPVPAAASVIQALHEKGTSRADISSFPNRTSTTAVEDASGERENFNVSVGVERAKSSHRPGPSTLSNGHSFRTYSGSRSLRKYASFQSGIHRSAPDHQQLDTTMSSDSVRRLSAGTCDKPPERMLRRRPGGDLRANQNVHDLEMTLRPRSAGSVTTYTDSMHASELYMSRTAKYSQKYGSPQATQISPYQSSPVSPVSPGSSMSPLSGKPLSLVRTHSSQPALRPSFEAAVAEFAHIPDDEGGDIEATMLKLEGKYRKSPPIEVAPIDSTTVGYHNASQERKNDAPGNTNLPTSTHNESMMGSPPPNSQSPDDQRGDATPTGDRSQRPSYHMASSLYAESEESYESTPLLERGLGSASESRDKTDSELSKVSIPMPLFSPRQSTRNPLSPLSGIDTESQRRIRYRSSIPTTTDSFLLDEDEYLSDLSSEISLDTIDREEAIDHEFASSAELIHHGIVPPDTGHLAASSIHPPTPPMNKETAMAIASQTNRIQDQRKPPTPGPSPDNKYIEPAMGTQDVQKAITPKPSITPMHKYPAHRHLPFVLTFDAAVIAEQFTIIEKDALNEINWQDLINMRWHHTSPSTLNWVDYLRTQQPTGIELVTARFNLVVKWVLSEIVLTQNVEERALCITKYIHIALYSRKTHNYATLLQLTIALTSIDCSRLTRTWDLVSAAEKRALKELENLVTPIKNFNNLRQEMETANADEGCIPVVGKFLRII